MTASKEANSDKNIEIIKQLYSGLNKNYVEAVMKLFHADIVRFEFEDSPNGGTYRGLLEMQKNFENGRSSWAEGACEPVEFVSNANKIVVTAHVKVRLKTQTEWIDAHVFDGFSFKDGLVAEFHSFTTKDKALEWAGISLDS